nr:phage integrase N-terminal SAM-like domain-containing protein [Flavobacterium sp. CBA20B-1]
MNGFSELLQRFERNISILGRSKRTFENYSRHIAAMALHFGSLPTQLDPEQVKDYLFVLQQRSKSLSQSYFKHTVYGLRLEIWLRCMFLGKEVRQKYILSKIHLLL